LSGNEGAGGKDFALDNSNDGEEKDQEVEANGKRRRTSLGSNSKRKPHRPSQTELLEGNAMEPSEESRSEKATAHEEQVDEAGEDVDIGREAARSAFIRFFVAIIKFLCRPGPSIVLVRPRPFLPVPRVDYIDRLDGGGGVALCGVDVFGGHIAQVGHGDQHLSPS